MIGREVEDPRPANLHHPLHLKLVDILYINSSLPEMTIWGWSRLHGADAPNARCPCSFNEQNNKLVFWHAERLLGLAGIGI